ncbi:hypothetical protein P171DRAFT_73880 [Karstenula rhodostoma CBS 690.94]|uniref:Uncharacterized protein n=1 Tax=Karstenula rhodostoma CBS 690.94 TaxID=1392251 RepID=A0A9P4U9T3_9PLEO|nr:hypothetical protein P171DRAFT_73880 [Karstenula rhodostoma CBS 690.94]
MRRQGVAALYCFKSTHDTILFTRDLHATHNQVCQDNFDIGMVGSGSIHGILVRACSSPLTIPFHLLKIRMKQSEAHVASIKIYTAGPAARHFWSLPLNPDPEPKQTQAPTQTPRPTVSRLPPLSKTSPPNPFHTR